MIIRQPKAVCKKCGRSAPAESFVLDNLCGMLVCPDCLKEQKFQSKTSNSVVSKMTSDILMGTKTKPAPSAATQPVQKPVEAVKRPTGWDSEDDYLERVHKQRDKLKVNFERLDESRIRYVCTKCGYKFVYHTEKKYPSACPNCGTRVITSVIR